MPPAHLVEIIVYDVPAAHKDDCGCGCDHHHGSGPEEAHGHGRHDSFAKISMAMQTQALALTLEKEFPGRVRVGYIDVTSDPWGHRCPKPSSCVPAPILPPWCMSTGACGLPGPCRWTASGRKWSTAWRARLILRERGPAGGHVRSGVNPPSRALALPPLKNIYSLGEAKGIS